MHKLKVAAIAAGMLVSGVASADLTANKAAILLGDVALGQSRADFVTITNVGTRVAQNLAVSISGNGSEFDYSGCTGSLFPGDSCNVLVTLTPQHYGAKRKKLTIDANELQDDGSFSDLPTLTIELVGTSDNPNKP